jgi:hypothetical protein
MRVAVIPSLVVAAIFVIAAVLGAAEKAHSAGMILNIRGDVKYFNAREKKEKKARELQKLYPGDKVTVKKGEARISFGANPDSCEVVDIPNGSVVIISQKELKVVRGKIVRKAAGKAYRSQGDIVRIPEGDLVLRYEIRGIENRNIRIPMQKRIYASCSGRPSFGWIPVEGTHTYHFTLSRVRGGKTIFERETQSSFLPYPKSENGLAPGENYLWKVSVLSMPFVEGELRIVSERELMEIEDFEKRIASAARDEPDSCSPLLILAHYYQEKALIFELTETFEKLVALRPDNENFREQLADYCAFSGRLEEAALQRRKAEEIRKAAEGAD